MPTQRVLAAAGALASIATMPTHEDRFRALVITNPVIQTLIDRLPRLAIPDCWITAGAVMQSVWNALEGRAPTDGIKDYDVFYFDPDLSWEAEDRIIRRAAAAFVDLAATIELRNQARVHLWFDERNGTSGYPRLTSACHGIDVFLETPSMFGIRPTGGGNFDIYAPRGYDDLFGYVHRPNPAAIGPESSYVDKATRRKALYPRLAVIPWKGVLRAASPATSATWAFPARHQGNCRLSRLCPREGWHPG